MAVRLPDIRCKTAKKCFFLCFYAIFELISDILTAIYRLARMSRNFYVTLDTANPAQFYSKRVELAVDPYASQDLKTISMALLFTSIFISKPLTI